MFSKVANASKFADLLLAFGLLVAPQRLTDAAQGLDHEGSLTAARRWRWTILDIVNSDRVIIVPAARALAQTFGNLPSLGRQLRREFGELEKKITCEQQSDRRLKALEDTITKCNENVAAFASSMNGSDWNAQSPGLAGELWCAYEAAVCGEAEISWQLVRYFAKKLHCDRQATG